MTPADPVRTLTRLRELAKAATPGPWRCAGTPSKRWPVVSSHDRERGYQLHSMAHIRDTDPDIWKHMKAAYCADAEYIAAVDPQTVLSILEQLQRATDASKISQLVGANIHLRDLIDKLTREKEALQATERTLTHTAYVWQKRAEAAEAAIEFAGWRHCPDCDSWWKVGSPAPDQTWRPIETADKTRPVLLHAKNQGRVVGYWHAAAENSAWETLPGWHRVEPTHWQPLPVPPGDGATIEVHARTCPRAQTDQQAVKVRMEPR